MGPYNVPYLHLYQNQSINKCIYAKLHMLVSIPKHVIFFIMNKCTSKTNTKKNK